MTGVQTCALPISILVFMVIISVQIPDKPVYLFCRKASTIIYLSHLIWYSIYSFQIIKQPNKLGLDSFVVTSALSMGFSCFLLALMKRKKFAWIQKIT